VYEALYSEEPGWPDLARLAHLDAITGRFDAADARYASAEEHLTAKEMRTFAWLEVQRGRLDLDAARYAEASAHYERADVAYSGDWVVAERLAELAAAVGRFDEAVERYRSLLAARPRPEVHQALGDVLTRAGLDEEAAAAYERAETDFLASAQRGEVHYLHHLSDLLADVRHDGPRALRWATTDLAARPGPLPRSAFAWALHRCGRHDEAAAAMDEMLATGVRTPAVLQRAEAVYRAAGRASDAARWGRLALELNPRPGDFRSPH
jgi:tetratricopeptide (TPR) repeat protein